MEIEKVNVLGVGISVIDQTTAREYLFDAVRKGQRGYVAVANVHSVSEAKRDHSLRGILNAAMLCTPDGMPLVWMGRLQGRRAIDRVYGPDLLLNLCEHSQGAGFTHFLYGGHRGVAEALADELRKRFPALNIVGVATPPFGPLTEEARVELIGEIARLRPDFFWVGLGMPKQEYFMAEFAHVLTGTTILLGVGAAFDFISGRVRQAPRWMMRLGLEWLFRLCQEPRRLSKRYLVNNPLFLLHAALQLTGLRRVPHD